MLYIIPKVIQFYITTAKKEKKGIIFQKKNVLPKTSKSCEKKEVKFLASFKEDFIELMLKLMSHFDVAMQKEKKKRKVA